MRFVRLMLALAVASAGLVLQAASASASSYDSLTITPGYGCPTESYCVVTFDSSVIGTSDDDLVTGTLTNLATGAPVAGFMDTMLDHQLEAGSYLLTIKDDYLGHWDCSIYYRDGCIWLDDSSDTYRWKFTYSGSGAKTVPLYVAPSTGFKKIPGKPLAERARGKFIVQGRVVATAETPNFGLANASAHRQVMLYRRPLHGGHWVRADRTRAHRNGKFRLQGAAPGGKKYRWYIWMPKRGTSPAFVGQTVRA